METGSDRNGGMEHCIFSHNPPNQGLGVNVGASIFSAPPPFIVSTCTNYTRLCGESFLHIWTPKLYGTSKGRKNLKMDGFTNSEWRAFLERGVVPQGGNVDLAAVLQRFPSLVVMTDDDAWIVDRGDFLRALIAVYGQHDTANIRMNVGKLCDWWLERRIISPAPSGAQTAYLRWLVLSDPAALASSSLLKTVAARGKLTSRDISALRWLMATAMSKGSLTDRAVDGNSGPALEVSMAATREKRRRFIHALNNFNEACRQGWVEVPDVHADGKFSYPDLDEELERVTTELDSVKESMREHDQAGVRWKGLFALAKKLYHRQREIQMEGEQRMRRLKVLQVARAAVRNDPYFDDGFVVPATLHPDKQQTAWRVNAREAKKDIAVMSLEATFGKPYATRQEQQDAIRAIKRSKLTDAIVTGTYRSYYGVDESKTPVDPKDNGAQIPNSFGGSVLNKF